MLLIGDIHGKWERYASILEAYRPNMSIQLGDFGWGFPNFNQSQCEFVESAMKKFGGCNRYFRGNHDNPQACKAHQFCLDDVSYLQEYDIFIIAGAESIDKHLRTQGVDWWEDEELSIVELNKAIDWYEKVKPNIVLSHEAPERVVSEMFPYKMPIRSRTRDALDVMLDIHQPDIWVFGHWHQTKSIKINNTRFTCLGELDIMEICI